MDISFQCPNCDQELEVDSSGAGSQIECPSCNESITVPEGPPGQGQPHSSIVSSAAAKEEHHFRVPTNYKGSEVLVKNPELRPEPESADGTKKLRIKTIRRAECVEVGKDNFDAEVTKFLSKIHEEDIINVSTVAYSTIELQSQKLVTDYGVLIMYRG